MNAISALLLTTTASTPPRSLVPLTEKLPTDDGVHPAARHPRRRRLEALTRENTEPIRLVLDGASLDEATAPKYSACFREGDWFMRGLPGPNPPATKAEATGGASGAENEGPASKTHPDAALMSAPLRALQPKSMVLSDWS